MEWIWGSKELDEEFWLMAGTWKLASASFFFPKDIFRKLYHRKYWNNLDFSRIGAGWIIVSTQSNPFEKLTTQRWVF